VQSQTARTIQRCKSRIAQKATDQEIDRYLCRGGLFLFI